MRRIDSRHSLFRLELIEGSAGSVRLEEADGTYLHHVGFRSEHFLDEIAALEDDGWQMGQTLLDADGWPSIDAYLCRPGDVRIEVVGAAALPAQR